MVMNADYAAFIHQQRKKRIPVTDEAMIEDYVRR